MDTVRMRVDGVNNEKTNNTFLYNSPSLISHKIDRLTHKVRNESVKRSKAKAKMILKMVTEKEGINLIGANLEEVFPSNLQELADKFLTRRRYHKITWQGIFSKSHLSKQEQQ